MAARRQTAASLGGTLGGMLNHLRGVAEDPSKVMVWFYYGWRHLAARLTRRGSGSAFFTPERPLMGYSIWRICRELGLRIVDQPDRGCRVALSWEDSTVNLVSPAMPPNGLRMLNVRCVDIRKTTVEAVSIATFGYGLAIDPRTHVGPFVRKSDENALHDGVILQGPRDPEPGFVDQRLLDNVVADGTAEDLRISIVGRRIAAVVRRQHILRERFDTVCREEFIGERVFSDAEVERVLAFCDRIGLDFGDLDAIRDRSDGRLYIVDANKTPYGPSMQVGIRYSLELHRLLARAFSDEFLTSAEPGRIREATE
jgi:hypothetical protein